MLLVAATFIGVATAGRGAPPDLRIGDPFHLGKRSFGVWKATKIDPDMSKGMFGKKFDCGWIPNDVMRRAPAGKILPAGPYAYDCPRWLKVMSGSKVTAFIMVPGWAEKWEVWTSVK